MDNDDGLDIPVTLRRDKWEKRQGYRKAAHGRHRRKAAKEKRFFEFAKRRSARRRKDPSWGWR